MINNKKNKTQVQKIYLMFWIFIVQILNLIT